MTWKEKIMDYVSMFPGATDSDIVRYYKPPNPDGAHRTVNRECRDLVRLGMLKRQSNPDKDGDIGNYPINKALEMSNRVRTE